ncbi:DUF5682 family protein [Kitasatospora sp. NPDC051853]|uniref:DUF5682 family protein n=1 Tax=Kitasatospora sp. NPDC051853 TaxID=3364058 RepID=UPI00379A94DF
MGPRSARAREVVLLGVRHHSPACAGLVARTIAELRPAHVLIEGPADFNDRLDELLLGHDLPVAVFSHHRDARRTATSWAPFCEHSPEWVALTRGRAAGAQVRFIDLPAWHPAFGDRSPSAQEPAPASGSGSGSGSGSANRFADAESRYAEAVARLCAHFGTDSVDTLWDGLFEVADPDGLAERLDAYFDLVRGDTAADPGDRAREEYMASWVRAAAARAEGPVLVVTGGFHTPALRALLAAPASASAPASGTESGTDWPSVPAPGDDAVGGSFLVPYSFRQLDAFAGYQSGLPSPGYYQLLWEEGPSAAADGLLEQAVRRLRSRRVPASTADLVAARSLADGLAALRGHRVRSRTDVLDGLAGALVKEALEQPLPWSGRGTLAPGSDPVVVEMVAAGTGERTGRLHPDTPAPPLVHDADAQLALHGVTSGAAVTADLTEPAGLERSRLLHRLRVLGVPGHTRASGPASGADPVFTERWEPTPLTGREAALVEAGAYGARVADAAAVALTERLHEGGSDAPALSALLFDAVLCGADALSAELLRTLAERAATLPELADAGAVLATALHLWRHDRVYGAAGTPLLARIIGASADRVLWLAEGLHGGGARPDLPRLRALAAARDAVRDAEELLPLPRVAVLDTARRIATDPAAPPDLRGAALGLLRSLSAAADTELPSLASEFATAGPDRLGDWLTGLFTLARQELTDSPAPALLDTLDELVGAMTEHDFLTGLPALRQAFAHFPPRERERIAERLLERRGRRGSARTLLRTTADPLDLARARALEESVHHLLHRYGLTTDPRTAR